MVNIKGDSNTRTHELEWVDMNNDPSEESETCVGVRASGTLVPHHGSLTFTNFFPLENTGSIVPIY